MRPLYARSRSLPATNRQPSTDAFTVLQSMLDLLYSSAPSRSSALMLAYVSGCERLGRPATRSARAERTLMTLESVDRADRRARPCSRTWSTRCCGRSSSEMTANGWLQILVLLRRVLAVAKPLGALPRAVYDGSLRWLAPRRARDLSRWRESIPTKTSTGRATPPSMLLFSAASMLLTYVALRLQHLLPLNPQQLAGGPRPAGVRDGGVVHDQHQLAVVQRRVDDVVLLADDAARVSQLRLRGRRHGGRRRVRARHRAPIARAGSATSGSTSCAARCTCCCRCRSCSRSCSCSRA